MLNERMSNRSVADGRRPSSVARDTASGKIENPNEALYSEYRLANWAFKVAGTIKGRGTS